jgi:PAB1-binding protein PBP1
MPQTWENPVNYHNPNLNRSNTNNSAYGTTLNYEDLLQELKDRNINAAKQLENDIKNDRLKRKNQIKEMLKETELAIEAKARAEAKAKAKAEAEAEADARASARASARKSARESRRSGVYIPSRTTPDTRTRREINEARKGSGAFLYKNHTKSASKEILGKSKRIYKVDGSKKEHVKHKGNIITVSDYKKLMK